MPGALEQQQLSAAMGAITHASGAEVMYGQLPDGQLYVSPSSVEISFGPQLTGAPPRQQHLRVVNKTQGPLQLQLVRLDVPTSSSSMPEYPNSPELAAALQFTVQQIIVATGSTQQLEVVANPCDVAGAAAAQYLLYTGRHAAADTSYSSCTATAAANPGDVAVDVRAEYQQLSVSLDRSAIDFGVVASYKPCVKQLVRLTNDTGVELRVRTQVLMPPRHSCASSRRPLSCSPTTAAYR